MSYSGANYGRTPFCKTCKTISLYYQHNVRLNMKNEKRSPGENRKKKTNLEKQENNQSKKTLRKVKKATKT